MGLGAQSHGMLGEWIGTIPVGAGVLWSSLWMKRAHGKIGEKIGWVVVRARMSLGFAQSLEQSLAELTYLVPGLLTLVFLLKLTLIFRQESTLDAKVRQRGIGEVGYGIRDTWIDPAETIPEIAPMTMGEVNTRVTELAELHEHDTQDLYALLEDAQDSRTRISQRVTGEIKKLEIELWNLKVKENNVLAYIERFQELTLICTKFVADETKKIDKYVNGLPYNIYRSVKASKPKMLDETIELANDLMDQNFTPISFGNANVVNAQRNNGANPIRNGCFECGATWHFKKDCPKLKNKDGERVNAPGWVYAVRNAEKNGNASRDPDSNVVTGTFLLNNRYASILFDTGADKSFISTSFSSLFDIVPTPLGNSYDAELADGKIVKLRRYHTVIVCDEKLVRIPYGNETLTFRGKESNNGRESRLTVISCSKAQEHMANGCQIFLAWRSAKKEKDKSEGKQLKDVPVIRDYPKIFLEDLSGLPPGRLVEF
nr:hypothetical protein [Tanacetum cinerariifolium]